MCQYFDTNILTQKYNILFTKKGYSIIKKGGTKMKTKIKQIREIKGITQEEMSRDIEISLTQYRNIEKNRSIPSVEIAIKIMDRLGIDNIKTLFNIDK